jgi:hypothetical protein
MYPRNLYPNQRMYPAQEAYGIHLQRHQYFSQRPLSWALPGSVLSVLYPF